MFRAIAIHLKKDIIKPSSCMDIETIKLDVSNNIKTRYIVQKELVYAMVKEGVKIIADNPKTKHTAELTTAESKYGEKYVRSEPDDIISDNLLELPRF